MRIVFTLCSNNYLAQAKTLGDSLLKSNPEIKFIIGLTDKFNPQVDYTFFQPFEILGYESTGFPVLESMSSKYNIIEFNTSVKPFYFEYLFQTYGRDSLIYYLDPDIFVYDSFEQMHRLLETHDFLVTPHINKPELSITYYETVFLNVGIYNLGFIGMRYSGNTMLFLKWWQKRLEDYCYIDFAKGLFVDQIWVNFIHLLFDKVHILRSPGYNMAYWNFHERNLITFDERYYVNDRDFPLSFFHFSGFKPENPSQLSYAMGLSFTSGNRPDLTGLYVEYANHLLQNKYQSLSKIAPLLNFKALNTKVKHSFRQRIGHSLKIRLNAYIKLFFKV